jgi:hypothetical protein
MAVSITRAAQQLNDVISQYPPPRLRQINQEKLDAMGIPMDLSARFLDHQSYTPTSHTVIVSSLEALRGAKGRDALLRAALAADSEESAGFFMYVAEILKGYQAKVSPIEQISVYGPLVFARAKNGTVVIPLPIDHAMWTEISSQRVPEAMRAYKATNPGWKGFEFWLTGTASKMAKAEAGKAGIKTVEKIGNQIEFTY